MRRSLPFLFTLVVLAGCASEKRLGEAKFQPRRYSRGLYVQQHASLKAEKDRPSEAEVHGPAMGGGEDGRTAIETESAMEAWAALAEGEANTDVATPRSRLSDSKASEMAPRAGEVPLSKASVPIHSIPSAGLGPARLLEEEPLPEPIQGYHPNAVPGFVLSLGWVIGWVAGIALSTTSAQMATMALVFGVLASIIGHFVSKRAFRMSRKHPDLYPRFKLPRAARFFSLLWLYAALLYVAVVLVFFLLFLNL